MKTMKFRRILGILGRFFTVILRALAGALDDLTALAGCVCILYGLSLWNAVLTWIVAGLMLVGLAVIIGKVR